MSDKEYVFPSKLTGAEGMSLRDYFAAKALQGLLASPVRFIGEEIDTMAESAYSAADAMMKARDE